MALRTSQTRKLRNFIDGINELTKYKLYVGATEHLDEKAEDATGLYKSDATLGEVVYAHEFGLGNLPVRSLVHAPMESDTAKEIAQMVIESPEFIGLMEKRQHKKALDILGEHLSEFLRDNWYNGGAYGEKFEELSETYEARKTKAGYGNQPLLTTLQMGDVFGWEIRR